MFSKKGKVPITSLDWLLLVAPPLRFLPSSSLSLSLCVCVSLDTQGQICRYKQLPCPWVINRGEDLAHGSEKTTMSEQDLHPEERQSLNSSLIIQSQLKNIPQWVMVTAMGKTNWWGVVFEGTLIPLVNHYQAFIAIASVAQWLYNWKTPNIILGSIKTKRF